MMLSKNVLRDVFNWIENRYIIIFENLFFGCIVLF